MKEVFELDVYKLAEELADKVWYDFDRWPLKVQKTVGHQIIRAADSISANLAEGYGRFTPAERKLFYRNFFTVLAEAPSRRPKPG